MVFRVRPTGPRILLRGPDGQIEMWAPEELVAENSVSTRITSNGATPERATADSAARAARAVHGKWTTYLAFRKSSFGIGFGGAPPGLGGLGPDGPRLNPREAFANLTPAQRVQQARQHMQER